MDREQLAEGARPSTRKTEKFRSIPSVWSLKKNKRHDRIEDMNEKEGAIECLLFGVNSSGKRSIFVDFPVQAGIMLPLFRLLTLYPRLKYLTTLLLD